MLPDFPKAKALIGKRHLKRFHDAHSNVLGPFMDMPQSRVHEGHRVALVREDGTLDEMEWKTVTVSEKINLDEVENWTEEQIYAHYERMAKQMAYQQKKMTYEVIDKAVKGVGNEVTLNGPPSAEGILQTYEKMWIEFQEDGKHVPLTLVCSPQAQSQFERAFQQLELDPEMRTRFEKLMQQKRNEWPERESARKLVGYTLQAFWNLLVRCNLKQMAKLMWPDVPRIGFDNFEPEAPWRFFQWRARKGLTTHCLHNSTQRWADLVLESSDVSGKELPRSIRQFPMECLALLLVYPHRLTASAVRWLDDKLWNSDAPESIIDARTPP